MDDINPNLALYIVKHESNASTTVVGDKNIICHNKKSPDYGKPVYSRGLWQLSRCYYPQVTDKEAYNPVWSTIFTVPKLASTKECKSQWTTCRNYYKGLK